MDTAEQITKPEDTEKSVQVDDRVILSVDRDGSVTYPASISGVDLYGVIDRAEKRITELSGAGKIEEAARETLHLFLAVTLFEISRLRADLDGVKACRAVR